MRKSKKLIDDEDEHLININNKVKLDLLSDDDNYNINDIEFDEEHNNDVEDLVEEVWGKNNQDMNF